MSEHMETALSEAESFEAVAAEYGIVIPPEASPEEQSEYFALVKAFLETERCLIKVIKRRLS